MNLTAPEPFPGRCLNHRFIGEASVRCLDYEGTSHVCSFPGPIRSSSSYSYMTVQVDYPPWVKPEVKP